MNTDINVTIARLQSEIQNHLGYNADGLIFDFSQKDGHTFLHLITINPRHNQSFLFHISEGIDKIDCLDKMLGYIKDHYSLDDTYTIQWKVREEKELHVSYFRANNMYQALDKLFYNRDLTSIIVYSCKLNPIS